MSNQGFKEPFVGKYDGVTPATMLEVGQISDGLNVRKISPLGGWKPRKGCSIHNQTALESGAAIKSLHQYTNPKQSDYHFIAQVNSKLYNSTGDPPTASGANFGTDMGLSVGATPGFSCVVGEHWIYADGSGRPIIWGGDSPYVFACLYYDDSADIYRDISREVTDGDNNNTATITLAASDKIYVVINEIAESITLNLGSSVNNNVETVTLKSWQAGAWSDRSATDGTASGGASLAVDGSITWARSSSDTMRMIGGSIMGYVYELSFSGLLDAVEIVSIKCSVDPTNITNKWNGQFDYVAGARFYDDSVGEYDEGFGKVTNESTSLYIDISEATVSDYLYLKAYAPATAFYLGIVTDYVNDNDAQIDNIEHWDGDSWVAGTGIVDRTLDDTPDSSFNQTGMVSWDGTRDNAKMSLLEGDPIPGYWYRISWDATLSTDVRIYFAAYATYPKALPAYKGCVEFKNRLILWGDPEFPNRLRFSAENRPDCFSGGDSGYTTPVGGADEILCAVKFYNELFVFKENSIFLLEGEDPRTLGALLVSNTVGLASPKTVQVAEVGTPGSHADEPLSVCLWQDTDGVYYSDGRKPRKISMPVDHFFNTEYATAIPAASIKTRQAFVDQINNEYHLLLPTSELVYNYATDEWYPPWEREVDLVTGLLLRGASGDNRYHTYGASAGGRVYRLENDTTDKATSNADAAISHKIKTRAISSEQEISTSPDLSFTLRKLWAELKARGAGSITTKTFKNIATSGTTQSSPSTMSMVKSGHSATIPHLKMNIEGCNSFQVEFSLNVADQEMEIRKMQYELDIRGLIGA